ncbi:MAG: NAD(P)/FAD-dependent oxidoreductase, partial [Roseiflexaceae bacterium]
MYDIAIVGCGPIGSGAARHASRAGLTTCIIGPHEAPRATHQVWSSHYDCGRLTHRSARNLQLALWANEALATYADIEQQSGIPFHVACGTLSISRDLRNFRYTAIRDQLESHLHFQYEDYTTDTLISRFPMLNADLGMVGIYDGAPAGYIDPRAMVKAQLICAQQQGTTLVRDIVTQLITHDDHVVIHTHDGQRIHTAHVIVAAGAYSGLCGLLPTPVPHTVKTETVVLGEISAATAAQLADMPSMMVDCVS